MKEIMNVDEYLSIMQKASIILLSANNFEPVRGKLWFHKELFLIAENISRLAEDTDFEEDLLGPYSEVLDAELSQLQTEGIVDKKKLRLTPFGRDIARLLESRASEDILKLFSDVKSFLNDLTQDELLAFIYFSYPHMAVESVIFKRIEENRQPLAIRLYHKKKVSLGKASRIAGVSQEEFIEMLRERGFTVFSE
jgi:predicted HTH domain antitoxin